MPRSTSIVPPTSSRLSTCITRARRRRTITRRWGSRLRWRMARMSHQLKSGQTPEDAAYELLGDRRLTNEIHIIGGGAYVRGEKIGPPARWAADPNAPSRKESE